MISKEINDSQTEVWNYIEPFGMISKLTWDDSFRAMGFNDVSRNISWPLHLTWSFVSTPGAQSLKYPLTEYEILGFRAGASENPNSEITNDFVYFQNEKQPGRQGALVHQKA